MYSTEWIRDVYEVYRHSERTVTGSMIPAKVDRLEILMAMTLAAATYRDAIENGITKREAIKAILGDL